MMFIVTFLKANDPLNRNFNTQVPLPGLHFEGRVVLPNTPAFIFRQFSFFDIYVLVKSQSGSTIAGQILYFLLAGAKSGQRYNSRIQECNKNISRRGGIK